MPVISPAYDTTESATFGAQKRVTFKKADNRLIAYLRANIISGLTSSLVNNSDPVNPAQDVRVEFNPLVADDNSKVNAVVEFNNFPPTGIKTSSTALNFGNVNVGDEKIMMFLIDYTSGIADSISVSSPVGYTMSATVDGVYADEKNYGVKPVNKAVYVKFKPVAGEVYAGNIVLTNAGGDVVKNVAVTGTGVVIP